jgi:hypothetical protein
VAPLDAKIIGSYKNKIGPLVSSARGSLSSFFVAYKESKNMPGII